MTDQRYKAAIEAAAAAHPHRVLFVCLGNICRSPAAQGVMQAIVDEHHAEADWQLDSAGMGSWHIGDLPDRRMRLHARDRGLTLDHRARRVTVADFDRYDLIVGMDSQNIADLRELAPSPEAEARIVPMGIFLDPSMGFDHVPDPYYEGSEGFELVLDLLQGGCAKLFRLLSC